MHALISNLEQITPRYIMGLSLSALRGNENSTKKLEEFCCLINLAIKDELVDSFNMRGDINFPI